LPRIFLATVADDQDDLHERLFNEIGHRAQVLEEIPPTLAYEAHTQAVATALGSADLSVHALGASPGRKIKDCRETGYPREQAEIALTQPVHQILWLPEDLSLGDVQDPTYRDWLQALETGEREQAELELVRCGTPDLIALTLDRIEEIRKGSGPDGELSFLIDTHQKDQRYAFRLGDLLAAQGADVDFNQESCDPVRSLAYFEHSVRQVQNLVILFGRVVGPWLQDRVRTAVKVLGEQFTAGEHETFRHLWIPLLPGSGGVCPELKLPRIIEGRVKILDNSQSETIDPQAIAELLALIDTGAVSRTTKHPRKTPSWACAPSSARTASISSAARSRPMICSGSSTAATSSLWLAARARANPPWCGLG